MMKLKFMPHQTQALITTEPFNKVAYYLDMGLASEGYELYGTTLSPDLGIPANITVELAEYRSGQHFFEFRVLVGKVYVRPYLCPRIA